MKSPVGGGTSHGARSGGPTSASSATCAWPPRSPASCACLRSGPPFLFSSSSFLPAAPCGNATEDVIDVREFSTLVLQLCFYTCWCTCLRTIKLFFSNSSAISSEVLPVMVMCNGCWSRPLVCTSLFFFAGYPGGAGGGEVCGDWAAVNWRGAHVGCRGRARS